MTKLMTKMRNDYENLLEIDREVRLGFGESILERALYFKKSCICNL